MAKYQWIQQQSGEDCAAASLAIIAKHYGRNIRINKIRSLVGTRQGGTTLLGLKYGAQELGFITSAIQAEPEILDELDEWTLPAIIFWKGYHFVVLYGQEKDKYVISDPAIGVRYLDRQEVIKGWQGGMMLLLEPDPKGFISQFDEEPVHPVDNLLKRLWEYREIFSKLLPLNLAVGIFSLSTPLLLKFLTDSVLTKSDSQRLTWVALGVIVIAVVNAICSFLQSNLVASFAEELQKGLKLEFGLQILNLPITYHEARRSGTAIRRLSDIQRINLLVSQLVIDLPIKAFIGLVALGFIVFYSWQLAVIVAAIGVIMTLSTIAFQPIVRQTTYRSITMAGENAGLLAESFNGALTTKTTTASPQLWLEIQHRLQREFKLNYRTAQIRIINNTFSQLMAGVGTVIMLWYGSVLVFGNQLSIGQLIAIYGLQQSFLSLITTLVQFFIDFTQVKAITRLLAELFEYEPENQGDDLKDSIEIYPQDDIDCQNISFYYPGRIKLIEDLSVTIPGGKVVGFIGKSGCGKSTLAKILTGLYSVQAGEINIGNHSFGNFSLICLRKQVVLVSQDAFFFHRSIIDNFRLSSPDVTLAKVIAACKIAQAHEFISQFPEQYETILGAVAANISGGQKQRLAIARAIVNDPPILILDESTANLDPMTEAEVLTNLLTKRQGKTTILISHRPKVINCADWIIFLQSGKVKFSNTIENFRSEFGNASDFLSP
ncbi:peptidase domain-containing ABC transporter [Synechocystis sp. PCC 7338]|uniref:peptidase domain-containing ABC transporter n=1 Tax=Synechocystis sp. PCC 7338 TaxID=2732530 RepID=UPI001BAFD682|nr:peptidase domain-containing ABC transporter [Synechocystis sp. PCC 7338]QUS60438.1 peptidase domain-containing ABC transporter [Synechocystis sp. PCC 7338]